MHPKAEHLLPYWLHRGHPHSNNSILAGNPGCCISCKQHALVSCSRTADYRLINRKQEAPTGVRALHFAEPLPLAAGLAHGGATLPVDARALAAAPPAALLATLLLFLPCRNSKERSWSE
jgi:hypothetical protein